MILTHVWEPFFWSDGRTQSKIYLNFWFTENLPQNYNLSMNHRDPLRIPSTIFSWTTWQCGDQITQTLWFFGKSGGWCLKVLSRKFFWWSFCGFWQVKSVLCSFLIVFGLVTAVVGTYLAVVDMGWCSRCGLGLEDQGISKNNWRPVIPWELWSTFMNFYHSSLINWKLRILAFGFKIPIVLMEKHGVFSVSS